MYDRSMMKPVVKRWLVILLIVCVLVALGLGVYLYITRPQIGDLLSLDNGPVDIVDLFYNTDRPLQGTVLDVMPPEENPALQERGVLLSGDDFSASILKDGRTGVGLDISNDINWDVSFDVNPWQDKYSFTTEWTIHM